MYLLDMGNTLFTKCYIIFCASFILERLGKAGKTPPAVLVVSPLLAQMQDQAHKFEDGARRQNVILHKSCSTRN